MRANELADRLAMQAESVASYLLPNGKRDGREWVCGDAQGNPGKSMKVCISGDKVGVWKDFAEDNGGDLLSLWCEVRNISVSAAMTEVREYLGVSRTQIENEVKIKPIAAPVPAPSNYLEGRGISQATQHRYKTTEESGVVTFPFYVGSDCLFKKFRSVLDKSKQWSEGDKPLLFGWQAIGPKQRTVIITEGEIDALSWMEMGYPALSVPNGAKSHGWVEIEFERLERFDKIYLALDADPKGREGVKELIARLGPERCPIIDTKNFKDANEILLAGEDPKPFIRDAVWQDPEELESAGSFKSAVLDSFKNGVDSEPGIDSPFSKLNGLLRFRVNEYVVLSGVNGHGKSQLAGMINLSAIEQGWKPVIFSGEMKPKRMLNKMVKQATAESEPSEVKINSAMDWLGEKMHLFNLTGMAKTDRLLQVFEYAHKRYGSNLFIIDSMAMCGIAEDDYNGQKKFVSQICDFRNKYPVNVIMLAHARKTQSEDTSTGKMDIKGTGAITDLADTVLTLWRNKPKERARFEDEAAYTSKFQFQADAILSCSKQRNGEWEGSAKLWWRKQANQFVEFETAQPQVYYSNLRAV
mgnify:CR=1 FL=1